MSLIKRRIESMCEIKRTMIKECITFEELRMYWFELDKYMDEYEGEI